MRTTLAIDDDLFAAMRELARTEHKSLGEVVSRLLRKSLCTPAAPEQVRNGVPLLHVLSGAPRVTSELVRELEQELP